jgi:N-acetylmuramoyl-L-alanine amidase
MSPSVYRLGDHGAPVREIRARLHRLGFIPEQPAGDESFDDDLDSAVRAFQQQRGLIVDGVVGRNTYRVLDEARWQLGDRILVHSPASPLIGDDVVDLQRRLRSFGVGPIDGIFGELTEAALREFQRRMGLPPDGTCGPATFKALANRDPDASSDRGAPQDREQTRRESTRLAAKVVVVDPGHGRSEFGRPGGDFGEADLAFDLARRIEGRLGATGAQAFLTRSRAGGYLDQVSRAEFANRTDANLCVSLNVAASPNPEANGVATFYYGSDAHGVHSEVGERFAGLVHREIVARTDLTDCRVHAKTWDLLRWTHMPTVLVDIGYATNPRDAARLADPAFRDTIAEAVVVAIRRVYLPPELDQPTGVMHLEGLTEQDLAG